MVPVVLIKLYTSATLKNVRLYIWTVDLCLCHTALGVQLMQYRLLIQFELEDQTDTLEALLWENAVST